MRGVIPMRPRKKAFSDLVAKNKREILSDEDILSRIDEKLEERQIKASLTKEEKERMYKSKFPF